MQDAGDRTQDAERRRQDAGFLAGIRLWRIPSNLLLLASLASCLLNLLPLASFLLPLLCSLERR